MLKKCPRSWRWFISNALFKCMFLLIFGTRSAYTVMCRTLIFTLLEADAIFPACSDGIFTLSKIACDDCNLVRCNEPEHCGQTSVSERGALTTTQWTNARPHWPIVNAAWWTQMSLSLRRHMWRTERNTDSDEGLLQSRKHSKHVLHSLRESAVTKLNSHSVQYCVQNSMMQFSTFFFYSARTH